MKEVKMEEIERLYEQCKVPIDTDFQIRKTINRGTLDNKLNVNFSNIYGKSNLSSLSNSTVVK